MSPVSSFKKDTLGSWSTVSVVSSTSLNNLTGKLATVVEISSTQAVTAGIFNAWAFETELVNTPELNKISSKLARSSRFLKGHKYIHRLVHAVFPFYFGRLCNKFNRVRQRFARLPHNFERSVAINQTPIDK